MARKKKSTTVVPSLASRGKLSANGCSKRLGYGRGDLGCTTNRSRLHRPAGYRQTTTEKEGTGGSWAAHVRLFLYFGNCVYTRLVG